MKNKIYYIVITVGFIIGVLLYVLNLAISNAETSSINPKLKELLRDPDYFTVFLYGFIGAGILFFLTSIVKSLRRQ